VWGIIGDNAILNSVENLEKLEGLKFDTFELGKNKLRIVAIICLASRKQA